MTDDSQAFDRQFGGVGRLFGASGADRIFNSHAVVVGIGGVGSWSAEAFARSGVSTITLIDLDHIAPSNINRQIHATQETFGKAKVLAMRDRILSINPACHVHVIEEFVSEANISACLDPILLEAGSRQICVVDACDQVRAKAALAAWAVAHHVIFVTVGAAGGKRLAHRIDCDDIASVTHDPLIAQVRYHLRRYHAGKRAGAMGVTGIFSREAVAKSQTVGAAEGNLNCHGYGSMVAVTASFGMAAAGWCLDQFAKQKVDA